MGPKIKRTYETNNLKFLEALQKHAADTDYGDYYWMCIWKDNKGEFQGVNTSPSQLFGNYPNICGCDYFIHKRGLTALLINDGREQRVPKYMSQQNYHHLILVLKIGKK